MPEKQQQAEMPRGPGEPTNALREFELLCAERSGALPDNVLDVLLPRVHTMVPRGRYSFQGEVVLVYDIGMLPNCHELKQAVVCHRRLRDGIDSHNSVPVFLEQSTYIGTDID